MLDVVRSGRGLTRAGERRATPGGSASERDYAIVDSVP